MPDNSIQNPILTFAPHDLVGVVTRMRPFLGQCGTSPSATIPDSHNAGDFGAFLVGAPHKFAMDAESLSQHKTDGHLDIDAVRAGAILVCPVKIPGGGVYLGDMHAMQGDGEIAGHTADVAGTVTLQVEVIKGLGIDGPVLFPLAEDLPFLAKPLTADERDRALALAEKQGATGIEESLPISRHRHRPRPQLGHRQRPAPRRRAARHERPGGHEPRDDHRRDRDRPRAGRRAGHVPGAGRGARGRGPPHLRDGAICLSETATPPAPRAGSTSPRPTSTAPRRFYDELFGWTAVPAGPPEETGGYENFESGGRRVAGVGPVMGEGQPTYWATYFATDDVDALTQRVKAAGGNVAAGADGRPGRRADGDLRPSRGRDVRRLAGAAATRARSWSTSRSVLAWNALMTRDVPAASAFLTEVFEGLSAESRRSSAAVPTPC